MWRWLSCLGLLLSLLHGGHATACGASAGGAAGVTSCSLAEHEEEIRKRWRVGAGYGFTSTAIHFGDGLSPSETRHVVFAVLDYRATKRWTLELGLGAQVGGYIDGAAHYDFEPGFASEIGASWRILDEGGPYPFVLATAQFAFVTTHAKERALERNAYTAFDLRLGALAGYPVADVLTPYLLVRAFGGPVYFRYLGEDRTGTDTHHYQVGAGAALLVAKTFDIFIEGVPLGERGVSAGVGVAF